VTLIDLTVAGLVQVPDAVPTIIVLTLVPAVLVADAQVVPLDVNTLPAVPAATDVTVVPAAFITNAPLPANDDALVPPFATGTWLYKFAAALSCPDVLTPFASCERLNACVIMLPLLRQKFVEQELLCC
jgi:hypothetical protein